MKPPSSTPPLSIHIFFFQQLLVGIGSVLRLYDLGKRRLLRKCENKLFHHSIVSIHTYRDRIYVGDIQEDGPQCLAIVNLVSSIMEQFSCKPWTWPCPFFSLGQVHKG